MIISDLNHLETVAETQSVVGGWYGPSTSIYFNVSNFGSVYQTAYSTASGGKATSGIGNSSANAKADANNYSSLNQSNIVVGVGIDP